MASRKKTAKQKESDNIDFAMEQVDEETPWAIIELIATQLDRADEAKRRIEEEGIVVRDLRGSVIPHPAIQIEINASKLAADLIRKNQPK